MPCNPNQIEINGLCCDSTNAQCIQNAIKSKPNTFDNILKIMTTLGTIAPSLIPLFMKNGTLPATPAPTPFTPETPNVDKKDTPKKNKNDIWIYVGIGVALLLVVILLLFKNKKS